MSDLTPQPASEPTLISAEEYFRLVSDGVLGPDDRVELLEGVIVAMTPIGSRHAAVTSNLYEALGRELAGRAAIRSQSPYRAGRRSVPEPDLAVVPGSHRDYVDAHPREALLVVEISDTTLQQDRLTKSRIYAAAGIPEYWIVNLASDVIELHRAPDRASARYADLRRAAPGERVTLSAFPDVSLAVDEILLLAR
jgi:Uma2 family endonuclease